MDKGNYQLMKDEHVILKSKNGDLMITNYRIRKIYGGGKNPSFTSMLLSDVTTISTKKEENMRALIAGLVIFIVGALTVGSQSPPFVHQISFFAILFGIGLTLYYLYTRKHNVQFKNGSGAIEFPFNITGNANLMEVTDRIEHLKIDNQKKMQLEDHSY